MTLGGNIAVNTAWCGVMFILLSVQPYKRPEYVLLLCSEATERTLLPVAREVLYSSTSGRLLSAAETGMDLSASTSEVRVSTPSRDLRVPASGPEVRVSTAT